MHLQKTIPIIHRICRISLLAFAICCSSVSIQAQDQLEIHQINVGNGDGALIKLLSGGAVVYTIVIDGGLAGSSNSFVPYLKEFIPDMTAHPGYKKVDWVILSHNHQDHFNGLVQMFKDPAFVVGSITDQGGYTIGAANFSVEPNKATDANSVPYITPSKSKKSPQQALVDYVKAVQTVDARTFSVTKAHITRIAPFDTTAKTFTSIPIPATIAGSPLTMVCIATNAYTRGLTTTTARDIGSKNPNNFTFGWILQFGQFRFYSGGDLGGYTTGYTNQETPMATYLAGTFTSNHPLDGTKTATNFPGHVCVMKTNHHGSTNSSRPNFLQTLAYSAIVTSAGSHKRWKIPTVEFVDRVAANPSFGAVQGVYFTQIYDYKGDPALSRANTKFKSKAAYNYVEPTDDPSGQYSYIFIVEKTTTYPIIPSGSKTVDITAESTFQVEKVRSSDYDITIQHFFKCHKP